MKLTEKAIRWLEAELIVVLAVVLLLGVLFGYSLAMSRMTSTVVEPPAIEEPVPVHIGGQDLDSDVVSEQIIDDSGFVLDSDGNIIDTEPVSIWTWFVSLFR